MTVRFTFCTVGTEESVEDGDGGSGWMKKHVLGIESDITVAGVSEGDERYDCHGYNKEC